MIGRNHINMNYITLGTTFCAFNSLYLHRKTLYPSIPYIYNYTDKILNLPYTHDLKWFGFVFISILLFGVGAVLPDICKQPWFPFKHRTWTHAIYFPIFCFVMSVYYPFLFWLGYSYLLHLIYDSFSIAGVCFLYPFSRYKRYSGGAFIKQGHHGLYRVNGGQSRKERLKQKGRRGVDEVVFVNMVGGLQIIFILIYCFYIA